MNVDFNADADHIDIPKSKYKLTVLLGIALCFLAAGLWFVVNPTIFENSGLYHRVKWEILGIGYITILFGILGVVTIVYSFFNNEPGLTINFEGIVFISMISKGEIVRWSDIEKFGEKDISQTRLIMIFIKNPGGYIEHQKGWFRRKLLRFNYNRYGALLSISTSALKCDFDELYIFLNNSLNNYNKDSQKYHIKG